MHPIDGQTKMLGLIGHGISHSLSPKIHNYTASALGLNCIYVPIDVAPEGLEQVLGALDSIGAVGFNVTVPHKVAVGRLVTGAPVSVNTLYRAPGGTTGWQAASTDGEGFCTGLSHLGRDVTSFRKLVLLGSGGAVQALVQHLGGHSFEEVTVLRRSDRHDAAVEAVASWPLQFRPLVSDELASVVARSDKDTLMVQGTSAPLRGDDLSHLLGGFAGYRGTFVDLVYGTPSALLSQAESLGLPCQDGLPMLIEQARCSQRLWWGKAASYQQLAAVVRGGGPPKQVGQ